METEINKFLCIRKFSDTKMIDEISEVLKKLNEDLTLDESLRFSIFLYID